MTELTTTDATDAAVSISIGADTFTLVPGDITPALAGALRQQSHGAWRVPTLMAAADEGIGPEELAGLLFLARRQSGDRDITYDAVCAEITASTQATITFGLATDLEADSPEA